MKKIITSLMALTLMFSASAQDGMKGKYLLGSSDLTATSWSDVQIQPNVGYFISDKIAIGATFSFSSDNDKAGTAFGETTIATTSFVPYVRYYTNNVLFFTGGFGISSVKATTVLDGTSDSEAKSSGFGIALGAGLSLMWGERFAVEPAFVLQNTSSSVETGNTSTDGPTSLSAGFQIGVSFRL
jgi:hypothetical protein